MGHSHITARTLQPKYPDLLKDKTKQKKGKCQRLKDKEIWDSALSGGRSLNEEWKSGELFISEFPHKSSGVLNWVICNKNHALRG